MDAYFSGRAQVAQRTVRVMFGLIAFSAAVSAEVRYRVRVPLELGAGCPCVIDPYSMSDSGAISGRVVDANRGDSPFIALPPNYQIVLLEDWMGTPAAAQAVNVHGIAAGDSQGGSGTEAFYWTPSNGAERIEPESQHTETRLAFGINDFNQVAGAYREDDQWRAYLWDAGSNAARDLGDLPGGSNFAIAFDVNNSGVVTGFSGSAGPGGSRSEAFIWTESEGMRPLGDASGGGYAASGDAINEDGQIAGRMSIPGQASQAFIWNGGGGPKPIGRLPGSLRMTAASALNNRGEVVGWGELADGVRRAFVWSPERGMRVLQELLSACDRATYPAIDYAAAITFDGRILARDLIHVRRVLVLEPYLPGDLNADRAVDLMDVSRLLTNFGTAGGASEGQGDLDCDRDVDLQDLATQLANLGESLP